MISPIKQPATTRRVSSQHRNLKPLATANVSESQARLTEVMKRVEQTVMPVWHLQDYVAVNPWAGLSKLHFVEARRFLRGISQTEMLPAIEHFRSEFAQSRFEKIDVQNALREWFAGPLGRQLDELGSKSVEREVWHALSPEQNAIDLTDQGKSSVDQCRRVRTVSEAAAKISGRGWSEWIQGELTKFCSSYFDQGQATWRDQDSASGIWAAWRRRARHDRNPQIWGLGGIRELADQLADDELVAIESLLQHLEVPEEIRENYLLCEVHAMAGWFAWIRVRSDWRNAAAQPNREFAGLLAIRLVYALALAQSLNLKLDGEVWNREHKSEEISSLHDAEDSAARAILLRASEIGFRRTLLADLKTKTVAEAEKKQRAEAQLIFCIDVRSERFRRQLESLSQSVETKGFAGFFGIPCEVKKWGDLQDKKADGQLPVLLSPQMLVQEELYDLSEAEAVASERNRKLSRLWRSAWKQFQGSLASCFPFVETTGWLGGWRMLQRSLGVAPEHALTGRFDGISEHHRHLLGPSLRGLNAQGWSTTRLADLAEGVLRNMGLLEDFARLVVLCGHRSEVTNNPLQASLDCGACGGHSGEANARFAALLLNQEFIRRELEQRGIAIPVDTLFTAAVHQTTSDELEFPDYEQIPLSHAKDLARLQQLCRRAGQLVTLERGEQLQLGSPEEISRRCFDWSEVRPEWGLAGNAAFIAGPRDLTRGMDLAGRTFLHDYDWRRDERGSVLELILTAPLVVASWINLQYYASTVDNERYGSGCKTIHNVVGKFGILSGAESDLQTGLPWQSVAVGERLQHTPLRLQAVVAAPRHMIDRVVAGHQHLRELLAGQWIHLIAIESTEVWQWQADGQWSRLEQAAELVSSP